MTNFRLSMERMFLICYGIQPSEREARVVGNSDFFIIDNENYFVRGIIALPIIEHEQTFNWGYGSLSARKALNE